MYELKVGDFFSFTTVFDAEEEEVVVLVLVLVLGTVVDAEVDTVDEVDGTLDEEDDAETVDDQASSELRTLEWGVSTSTLAEQGFILSHSARVIPK